MKFKIPMIAASALLMAACSTANVTLTETVRNVKPEKWTVIEVGDGKDQLAPGQYDLDNQSENTKNPANYAIYVSDDYYDSFNQNLEPDLIQMLNPDQDTVVNLKKGNYLYVSAVSVKTGEYEDGLTGQLNIEISD